MNHGIKIGALGNLLFVEKILSGFNLINPKCNWRVIIKLQREPGKGSILISYCTIQPALGLVSRFIYFPPVPQASPGVIQI